MKKRYLLIPIILIQILLLIYLKFTAWPEMSLWPYLIMKGWLPYRDIAIAHTPLMIGLLAVIYKIFGVGILQLKLFTWVLIIGLDGLIFWVAKRLWNFKTALFTVSAFAFWQILFDGNGLWFDLFMGAMALASYYFIQRKNFILAGVFWAAAFFSKQTAVWFLIPIGLEIFQNSKLKIVTLRDKSLARFLFGSLVILVLLVILLLLFGILPDFYNWAVSFGIFILPKAQGQIQLPDLKNVAVSVFPFMIFAPLIWEKGRKNVTLLIWAIAGSLGAYPRFEYFHLQPAIPFLALATGIFFTAKFSKSRLIKTFVIFYALGSIYLFGGFFMRNFNEGVRFYEQDVQDVVAYVKLNSNSGDRVFVLNWWDNIYAFSSRMPATDPYVPQLSWYMEISGVQEKMVKDLIISKPKMIILNPYTEAGLSAYVPQTVYNYVTANYTLKEKVDNLEVLIHK